MLATRNPCELLKGAEIAKMLGQPTGPATEGLTAPVLRQCYWDVEPAGEFPAGSDRHGHRVGRREDLLRDRRSQSQNVEPVRGIKKSYNDNSSGR